MHSERLEIIREIIARERGKNGSMIASDREVAFLNRDGIKVCEFALNEIGRLTAELSAAKEREANWKLLADAVFVDNKEIVCGDINLEGGTINWFDRRVDLAAKAG